MPEPVAIHVPRENVNDESVKLVAWLVGDRQAVTEGQVVAEIETSKATADVISPTAGFLVQLQKAGDEVEVGGMLGEVVASIDATASTADSPARPAAQTAPTPSPVIHGGENGTARPSAANGSSNSAPDSPAYPKRRPRIGPKALELMRRHGLQEDAFADHALVRENDVRKALGQPPIPSASASGKMASAPHTISAAPVAGVPVRLVALPRAKRIEARYLSAGLHQTLPSVVTVACPTRGLKAAAQAHLLLQGQTSALLVYEVARLLRSFPIFNACYQDGSVAYYEQVNIGYALDVDRGLKVPVLRDADVKPLGEIAEQLRERIVEYLEDQLPVESLAGGTFTVTDLSGDSVFSFHPLINQSQSAILGIGGEFFAPGSDEGLFNLILAFDHQLSAGREAARFLNELKRRISAYEAALTDGKTTKPEARAEEPYCSQCFATFDELRRGRHHLLQSVGSQGEPQMLCTRCATGLS